MKIIKPIWSIVLLHFIFNGYCNEIDTKNLEYRLRDSTSKSTIKIISPNRNTIWTIPDLVSLEWETTNIGPEKSIRFFLVRDDTVVQELGSFKNNSNKRGIKLAKNIGVGDTYRVVGIELFPDNKFEVSKFVTPHFSIRNKLIEDRKKKELLAIAIPKKDKAKIQKQVANVNRENFRGRNISYIKELVFNSEKLKISIWDHGRQDGDIVSIYLNGMEVISKHSLTYVKKDFEIQLTPNTLNDLFLYAHNLGTVPPNTVSVEISDGTLSENIVLNSDLKSCEAVLISVKL